LIEKENNRQISKRKNKVGYRQDQKRFRGKKENKGGKLLAGIVRLCSGDARGEKERAFPRANSLIKVTVDKVPKENFPLGRLSVQGGLFRIKVSVSKQGGFYRKFKPRGQSGC